MSSEIKAKARTHHIHLKCNNSTVLSWMRGTGVGKKSKESVGCGQSKSTAPKSQPLRSAAKRPSSQPSSILIFYSTTQPSSQENGHLLPTTKRHSIQSKESPISKKRSLISCSTRSSDLIICGSLRPY